MLKGKSKLIFGLFFGVLFILFLMLALLSTSPQDAVRLRIAYMGHLSYAVKCHPKYNKSWSNYTKSSIYTVEKKVYVDG